MTRGAFPVAIVVFGSGLIADVEDTAERTRVLGEDVDARPPRWPRA